MPVEHFAPTFMDYNLQYLSKLYSPSSQKSRTQLSKRLPEFNQRLPEFSKRLPEFNQRLPEFNQQLPDFSKRLPEFNQRLPEFKRLFENWFAVILGISYLRNYSKSLALAIITIFYFPTCCARDEESWVQTVKIR